MRSSTDLRSETLPVIRDARPADLEAVLAVDDLAAASPERTKFIEHAIHAHACLVAEDRGRILGYGVLEHSFFSNGFISMLYVAGSARRRGSAPPCSGPWPAAA